ncbi:MAG: hypothetical protein U0793_31370 [Gemmataceae bacterium]
MNDEWLVTYSAGSVRVYDFQKAGAKDVESVDRKGKATKTTKWSLPRNSFGQNGGRSRTSFSRASGSTP